VATAVVEFVHGSLAAKPPRVGLHSARRGDYRVIYRTHTDRRRVDVLAVEHRSDAYRRR